jgi:hypothetical protein
MISFDREIIFLEYTYSKQDGYDIEFENRIKAKGAVSFGSYTIKRDDNSDMLTASLRITVKDFEKEKLTNPKAVIIDNQKLKVKGMTKYSTHWEIYV